MGVFNMINSAMGDAVGQYNGQIQQLQQIHDDAQNTAKGLLPMWTGQDADAYQAKVQQELSQLQTIISTCGGFMSAFTQAQQLMNEADNMAQGLVNDLESSAISSITGALGL